MKLLTLNVGAASVQRAERIAGWLLGQEVVDTIVLTETTAGSGSRYLYNRLLGAGYFVDCQWPHGDRGAMLATSTSIAMPVRSMLPWRSPAAVVPALDGDVTVIGLYGPSRSVKNRLRKETFFASMLDWLKCLGRDRLVLAGDYNAIPRDHEPRHVGFRDFEYDFHDGLAELGLRAAHFDIDPQPHSWYGRSGAGYLYDYLHLGPGLAADHCDYLQEPRELGISDHAAVIATVVPARPLQDPDTGEETDHA